MKKRLLAAFALLFLLCFTTNSALAQDCDGDGISDELEEWWGTDPCNADSDYDGLDDFDEYDEGTNPHDPDTDGDGAIDGDDETPYVNDDTGEEEEVYYPDHVDPPGDEHDGEAEDEEADEEDVDSEAEEEE